MSRGGWTRDGEWIPVAFVDEHSAELLYLHKVMRLLQDEGLLTQERAELLLSWRHTESPVHNRVRVEPEDQSSVERLARSIMRPPISLERMGWGGVGEVRHRQSKGYETSRSQDGEVASFDPAEFLARVIMHIPEPRRHLVRYSGWYSEVAGSSASWPTACRDGEPIDHALMTEIRCRLVGRVRATCHGASG